MFTGLIEEMGIVLSLVQDKKTEQWILTISAHIVLEGVKLGDSIAVNGVCLTVTAFDKKSFVVGLSPETLRKTNAGELKKGDPVNLERSLAANGKFGGHFVQGHVDGTGTIISFKHEKDSLWVTVRASPELIKFIVEKAYIAVDGTSLTVCEVGPDWFNFMLVQYTQSKIVVAKKKVGDKVNLEVDIMGKYVASFMSKLKESKGELSQQLRAKL